MSRISSSVGLITGIPIEDTVTKLMQVAARPRDLLKSRNDALKQQQLALDTMGSRLLAFQFALNKLKSTTAFQAREASSSKPDAVAVALPATGAATIGTFQVRPLQTASAQQFLSQRIENASAAWEGSLSLQLGGHLNMGLDLAELNGGAGVPRGKIRITDRSGDTATIDLSYARSVDDVLAAINANDDVSVTASTDGDSFVLTDASGGAGNLRVQEVGAGSTAAGLGLAGISVAASTATGGDVLRLHAGTKLAALNDGNGVELTKAGVADLAVTLADGTELSIDLHDATTLGDVVSQINAANPSKLSAAIAADGRRLQLTDLSGASGAFRVENAAASSAASALHLAAEVSGSATISGGRLMGGLRDTLLSSLRGGDGIGVLGQITITDRAGVASAVDLSGAETVGDVVALINAANSNVAASINAARNGIAIVDKSGGSGVLTIADADGTNAASALNIGVAAAVESVNSGNLAKQTLSRSTLLSSLNGGKGAVVGKVRVTDSRGSTQTAALDGSGAGVKATTVGELIDAINALVVGVEARINDAGDGVIVIDTAGGTGNPALADVSGNLAASLRLTRASQTIDVGGTPAKAINGSAGFAIDLAGVETGASDIPLSSLNGGKGLSRGDVTITDSNGKVVALDLNGGDADILSVRQLIDAINVKAAAVGAGLAASLDPSGTGIKLQDTAGGTGALIVRDVNSTTAAELKLTGAASTSNGVQTIAGVGAFAAPSGGSGLNAIAARINALQSEIKASTVFDGQGYRLALAAAVPGAATQWLVDAGASGLVFDEVSSARDALLLYGDLSNPATAALLNSPTGEFAGAVGGVDVTVKQPSSEPVTVTVRQTNSTFLTAIDDIVSAYNSLRSDLSKLTSFDAKALTTGLLFGTNEALQIDSRVSQALTARYFSVGAVQSLEQLGVSVNDDGTLSVNKVRLQNAFASDPEAVERFFTDADNGVVAKLNAVIGRLAGTDESMLAARSDALKNSIDANQGRLDKFDAQLERQRERLFLQFTTLESVIAKLQSSLTAIQNLQVLPSLVSVRNS
jgi:flagellar hook-associated protein 2